MTAQSIQSWQIRRDGTHLILLNHPGAMPEVAYWGSDLGELTSQQVNELATATQRQTNGQTTDAAWRMSVLPQGWEGWFGRPGLQISRSGQQIYPRFEKPTVSVSDDHHTLVIAASDDGKQGTGVSVELSINLARGGAVIEHIVVRNERDDILTVLAAEPTMPVPRTATMLTTFAGRWPLEKQPNTIALPAGSTIREAYRGKPGHDSAWIQILSDGTPRHTSGHVWASHVAWSGDSINRLDNLSANLTAFGGGEQLTPGEIQLSKGEQYQTPDVAFAWSNTGLDGIGDQFVTWVRSMPGRKHTPRPFTLNTWEAVYFDQHESTLLKLADKAAQVGVERFVLDDGWFKGRRDDTRALGDWVVDQSVWPHGLDVLASHVHQLGMEFGLWFEPEMISADSDLARAHHDWILGDDRAWSVPAGISYRHQFVLDLANDGAWKHVHDQMAQLIRHLHIDYIKWDHNRNLVEPVHQSKAGSHAQVLAVYRLIDALKSEFPWLDIESCSSGGARTDAGMLRHCDRVWGSDTNDPRDRADIQNWTELLVPPEMLGAHIGPSPADTTGRQTDLSLRCAIALEGCPGLEWNLLRVPDDQLQQVNHVTALYRRLRPLLHSGHIFHEDAVDPACRIRGVVDDNRSHAVVTIATVDDIRQDLSDSLRLPQLDDNTVYRIRQLREIGDAKCGGAIPQWLTDAHSDNGFVISGRLLSHIGLQLPTLWPLQALMLEITAEKED